MICHWYRYGCDTVVFILGAEFTRYALLGIGGTVSDALLRCAELDMPADSTVERAIAFADRLGLIDRDALVREGDFDGALRDYEWRSVARGAADTRRRLDEAGA